MLVQTQNLSVPCSRTDSMPQRKAAVYRDYCSTFSSIITAINHIWPCKKNFVCVRWSPASAVD